MFLKVTLLEHRCHNRENCAGVAEPLSQRRSEEGYSKAWPSPSRSLGGGGLERSMLGRSSTAGMGQVRVRGEPWVIDPGEIKIMQRSDGGPWVLGEGASGSVGHLYFFSTYDTAAGVHTLRLRLELEAED